MTMTYDQVAELLAFCAVHDKRKGDDLDVKAWLMVAQDHGWTAEAAFRVAREHYGQGENRPRLEAPGITDRIRGVRKRAAESFEPPVIPAGLPAAEYPEWYRRQLAEHRDGLVREWGQTGREPSGQLPAGPPPNQLGQRRMAELTAGAFQAMPAAGRDGTPPTVDDVQDRRSALAVPCPYCSARPNQPCTRSGASGRVRMKHPHPARGDRSHTEEAS